MTDVHAWLAERDPAPPSALEAALESVLARERGASTGGGEAASGRLAELGRARLEMALARTGRERQSAYRLLEADALFTYACEAALEGRDPVVTLRGILTIAGR